MLVRCSGLLTPTNSRKPEKHSSGFCFACLTHESPISGLFLLLLKGLLMNVDVLNVSGSQLGTIPLTMLILNADTININGNFCLSYEPVYPDYKYDSRKQSGKLIGIISFTVKFVESNYIR